MRHVLSRTSSVALLAATFAGCSDSTTTESEPGIKAVLVSAMVVPHGFDATTFVTVDRGNDYHRDVSLVAESVPAGLKVTITPATLTNADEIAQMKVSAPVSVEPGPYTFRIRATGAGALPQTTTVFVNVSEPSFSVNLAAQSAQVEQGATVTVPINVERAGGYSQPVDLSVSGVPTELSGIITPSRLQPGQTTAQLQLAASYLAMPTTATILVRASAVGLPQKTATLPLAVVPATTPAIFASSNPIVDVFRGVGGAHVVNGLRFGGFTGDVTFQLAGAPNGVTMTAPPLQIGQSSAQLSFSVPVAVTNGTYPVTLRASGVSIAPFDMQVSLRVSTIRAFDFGFRNVPPDGVPTPSPTYTVARGVTLQLTLQTVRFVETEITLTPFDIPSGITLTMPQLLPATPADQLTTFSLVVSPEIAAGLHSFFIQLVSETTGYTRLAQVRINVP